MTGLSDEIRTLRETDPDVALVLNTYDEIERVYHEALKAMGLTNEISMGVENSAEVTISFKDMIYTSG